MTYITGKIYYVTGLYIKLPPREYEPPRRILVADNLEQKINYLRVIRFMIKRKANKLLAKSQK